MTTKTRIEPYEVVRISDGETWMPMVIIHRKYNLQLDTAYSEFELRKDGEVSKHARGTTVRLLLPDDQNNQRYVYLYDSVPFEASREEKARPIRDAITDLREQLKQQENALLGVYSEFGSVSPL